MSGWAPLGRIARTSTCRYGALANQRLGPRTSPRNPPGWTEHLPSFTSSYDSTNSRVLSDRTGASSQMSSPRTSVAWPTMLGHPLSPISSWHSYAPPTTARLQSAALAAPPTRPRTPLSPRTPRELQVWLGDLGDQPWHGRSDKARLSRSHASRASRSSTLSGPQSSRLGAEGHELPRAFPGVALKSSSPLRVSLSGSVETYVETPRFLTPVAPPHPLPKTSRHWYANEEKQAPGSTPRTEHLYLDRTRQSPGATPRPAPLPYTAMDSARALLTVLKSPPVHVAPRAY